MKMSTSSSNLHENIINIKDNQKDKLNQPIKKRISVQDDYFKKEIFKKLNEGSVLHFIRSTAKKDTVKTTSSEKSQEMKYDLSMLNKYDEDLNSSLSFISEFDLENDENDNDNSFDSCFDENSVEEIDIIKKEKKQKSKYDE